MCRAESQVIRYQRTTVGQGIAGIEVERAGAGFAGVLERVRRNLQRPVGLLSAVQHCIISAESDITVALQLPTLAIVQRAGFGGELLFCCDGSLVIQLPDLQLRIAFRQQRAAVMQHIAGQVK